ncbi:MAG TPA: Gldg family protein [Sedimentisphaerales bacterium]|nr:Gldg family protein [Sedimentisphaerales bacterium]
MNRTLRAILGAVLILIITFSGISICQNIGSRVKVDVTEQGLYTLSDGTKAILNRLNQPITAKLYFARKAAMKAPDQIQYFTSYFEFVKSLLEEYVAASGGKVKLQVIDPRPFSDDEEQAMRLGLQRFPITENENFFFGLVIQTQFGVDKVIPFFSPDRHNFVEYDISYLIDTAITKQKKKIGILSSLPVMGQDASDYMARMMQMQGQQLQPPWTFVEQLKNKYEVTAVPTDVNEVKDVDILIVVHPKNLSEQTQFAIDQFVLKGGRTIVFVDPHCIADRPQRNPMQMSVQNQNSSLDRLMRTWGLEMPANTFAGDRSLAMEAAVSRNARAEKIIGYLALNRDCFNRDNPITTELNEVRMLFAGVLNEINVQTNDSANPSIRRMPLVTTTKNGNAWKVGSSFELMFPDPAKMMASFVDGDKPVAMGYLVTGRFPSSFPEGIEVEADAPKDPNDPNDSQKIKKRVTGLTEATVDCAVVVFSDVDFISDQLAYASSIFGKMVVGDNSALLMNTVEELSGSGDLIAIRTRGNFKRPFTVVDAIEREAERASADEVALVNAQIDGFNQKLQELVSSAKGEDEQKILGSDIVKTKRELEMKIRDAQKRLRTIKEKSTVQTDQLGNKLKMINIALVPSVILVVAAALGIWRSVRKRHYISHASDA